MEEKVTFFGAYGRMWANTFNYKGTASRKEYWFPFVIQVLVFGAACGLLYASFVAEEGGLWFCLAAFALGGFLVLSVLPWISLTVRRLRDAGKSGWLALLMLIAGVGMLILLILCASASVIYNVNGDRPISPFNPAQNEVPCVYGPPEVFDPSQNQLEEVYGPPFTGEEEPVEEISEEELNDEPIVDPDEVKDNDADKEDNDGKKDNNGKEDSDGKEDNDGKTDKEKDGDYDPVKNMEPLVYGPPEMMQ